MSNFEIYCLCLQNELLNKVKKLNYIPVGLGNDEFSNEWLLDNTKLNISNKNKFYGEYTFHYWFWKNLLPKNKNKKWIGFCTYRRFWENYKNKSTKNVNFKNKILDSIPNEFEKYDVILGNKIDLSNLKFMKLIKYGKLALLNNPMAIFRKGRNIKFQFDMFHGLGILEKAISALDEKDREDFKEFVYKNNSYNQGNMFICKSTDILENFYKTIFEWLSKCEEIFGFELYGYKNVRLYAFLAERFMPYWFNKYSKVIEWPIIFQDLRNINTL